MTCEYLPYWDGLLFLKSNFQVDHATHPGDAVLSKSPENISPAVDNVLLLMATFITCPPPEPVQKGLEIPIGVV
ncbi:hypothetical protein [Providencia rettgeri]|uniref:hypothetical protein n=1 Tax=Providencia rettgeri TaxID=587 RepID=UPI0018E4516B|nr:hypothetical protein [Providencia rettgeri]MBI6194828.1 hypothetical protein [Providencia rettgeri]